MLEKLNWFRLTGLITLVLLMGLFLRKNHILRLLGLTFYSKLDWGFYNIISFAQTASKKIAALICSMEFLSPEVAVCLHISTIRLYMEHCFHFWADAPSYYLELSDKLQKRIYRTVGPSLASALEPLAHRWSKYYFCRCLSELVQLIQLPCTRGTSSRYSDRLHDFSVTLPRCYKDA